MSFSFRRFHFLQGLHPEVK